MIFKAAVVIAAVALVMVFAKLGPLLSEWVLEYGA